MLITFTGKKRLSTKVQLFLKTCFSDKVIMAVKLITILTRNESFHVMAKCLFLSQLFEFLKSVKYERSYKRKCFAFIEGDLFLLNPL